MKICRMTQIDYCSSYVNNKKGKDEKPLIQPATIQIDAKKKNNNKINPYIFGHFVEDIRDHYDAMLAYSLKTMDFEEEAGQSVGVSGLWYPVTNGRNTLYALESAAPKHSGHSQKIRIFSDDQCYAGIAQKIVVKGDVDYTVTLFARASIEIKQLTIEVVDAHTRDTLSSKLVEIESHDWREYSIQMSPMRECAEAEFRVIIRSEGKTWKDSIATGILWLDHVSMLCVDRVGIVDKTVVDMTRELNCGMMRLGGNHISAYHWEHGVGPMYERPNMINEAWNVMACKTFGTDEFLQFCEELQAEPLICVNDGSGTPEEAARWVEYCNGSADTTMGAKRAANGHSKPYRVKYWEVGNEVWGPWQVGHCSAEDFAKRYIPFAKAMKRADPDIKLLACGHTDPKWNKIVLELAGEYIDYLTMHIYQGYSRYGFIHAEVSREEKYKAIVAYPEYTRSVVDKTEALIRSNPKASHVKLAITEHNTMYYPNMIRKNLPNEHTLEAAVANAGNLNEFIRSSHLIEIGSFSDLVNGWLGGCIRVGDYYADQFRGKKSGWSGKSNVIYGTPTYHMMKMYANRELGHVVSSEVVCDEFSVSGNTANTKLEHLPVLDVVSCINDTEDVLTVFVVNRSLKDIEIDISLTNFEAGSRMAVYELTGDDIDSMNDVFQPENITVTQSEIHEEASQFKYTLKAHSVYTFEVRLVK